jgi:hypothetical protein
LVTATSVDGPSDDRDAYQSIFSRETVGDRVRALGHNVKAAAVRFWTWLDTPSGRGVLKCTLAYFLGTMATFLAPLSSFLGKPDGKHIVATITVYFHPARTTGSMLESIMVSAVAVFYAEIVCLLSMGISVLFGGQLGLITLAHLLVLLICIGAGLGFIGWVKQKLNNSLVNTASTLASIAIIAVITKEDAVHAGEFSGAKIEQVLKMLIMGISIAAAVNFLVWRVSARLLLRDSMSTASKSLGDALSIITRGFLNGSEEELFSDEYKRVSDQYKSSQGKMTQNLREAKFEHYFLGQVKIYRLDKTVFKSLETLSQAIGGLRSASNTQFALLKEMPVDAESGQLSPGSSLFSPTLSRQMSSFLKSSRGRLATLAAIDESEENDSRKPPSIDETLSDIAPGKLPALRIPSDIFELFITLLGPSMKSLAYTLSEVLRDPPFGSSPDYKIMTNDHFKSSLDDALSLYNSARSNAIHELYLSIQLDRSRSEKIQADIEEVAAACGHFSFTLQNVAEEMQAYLDVLDELKEATESSTRSWHWLKFWKHWHWHTKKDTSVASDHLEAEALLDAPEPPVKAIRTSAMPKGIPDTMVDRRDNFSWNAAPDANKFVRETSLKMLRSLRILARDDIRFGIKVGLGAVAWAAFAFIPATRPTYTHWRGEWGLLSFVIVCTINVGSSNTAGTARFLGTIIGATLAFIGWSISQGNGVALAFLGWLVSLWNFYIILVLGYGPMGRITLLAWNVTVLYAYSLSQKVEDDDDDEGGTNPLMWEIVYHRVIAVTLGILWGLIVCRVIWPISGRRKFKEGLAVLYLQLGLIWKRGPLAILLRSDSQKNYLKAGEDWALQRYSTILSTYIYP